MATQRAQGATRQVERDHVAFDNAFSATVMVWTNSRTWVSMVSRPDFPYIDLGGEGVHAQG
jgi:hypothetical protein